MIIDCRKSVRNVSVQWLVCVTCWLGKQQLVIVALKNGRKHQQIDRQWSLRYATQKQCRYTNHRLPYVTSSVFIGGAEQTAISPDGMLILGTAPQCAIFVKFSPRLLTYLAYSETLQTPGFDCFHWCRWCLHTWTMCLKAEMKGFEHVSGFRKSDYYALFCEL